MGGTEHCLPTTARRATSCGAEPGSVFAPHAPEASRPRRPAPERAKPGSPTRPDGCQVHVIGRTGLSPSNIEGLGMAGGSDEGFDYGGDYRAHRAGSGPLAVDGSDPARSEFGQLDHSDPLRHATGEGELGHQSR